MKKKERIKEISRKKRAMGNVESDEDKGIRRQMGFGRGNHDGKAIVSIDASARYRAARRASRPENTERRVRNNEVNGQKSEWGLDLNDMDN